MFGVNTKIIIAVTVLFVLTILFVILDQFAIDNEVFSVITNGLSVISISIIGIFVLVVLILLLRNCGGTSQGTSIPAIATINSGSNNQDTMPLYQHNPYQPQWVSSPPNTHGVTHNYSSYHSQGYYV